MYFPAIIKNTRIYVCSNGQSYEIEPVYRWFHKVDNETYNYIYNTDTHRLSILDSEYGVLEEDLPTTPIPLQRVIGLSGKKGSGKDAAADHIMTVCSSPCIRIAFADALKESAIHLFGLDRSVVYGSLRNKERVLSSWGMSARQLLQTLGDAVRYDLPARDSRLENVFVRLIEHKIIEEFKQHPTAVIVVTDVRFQDEVSLIRKFGGVMVHIDRSSYSNKDPHPSENQFLQCDYTVDNNSTFTHLYTQLSSVLSELTIEMK
jgi:hypothetical protein